MKKTKLFFFIILFSAFYSTYPSELIAEYTSFVIVVASYNNKKFYKKNLDSIVNQKIKLTNKLYPNYRIIYVNDCSADDTGSLVDRYIQGYSLENLVKVIHNKNRKGHLYNQYHAIHSCKDSEVIVIVDGDDFLYDDYVLDYLNQIYSNKNIWLTYGQYQQWPYFQIGNSKYVPKYYFENKLIRKIPWCFSHLRTFYAGLFKKINKQDLLYNNYFFKSSADLATMYPMLEMAGYDHVRFIPKILYLYNVVNSNSFFRTNINLQFDLANYIKSKQSYGAINNLFL